MIRSIAVTVCFGLLVVSSVVAIDCSNAQWQGKPWLGRWKSTDRQENWEAFARALEFSPVPQVAYQEFWLAGDEYHHNISVPSAPFSEERRFKLPSFYVYGVIASSGSLNSWEYNEVDGKLVSKVTIEGKTRNTETEIQGDELIETYKTGDVVAKRWYTRVPNSCSAN